MRIDFSTTLIKIRDLVSARFTMGHERSIKAKKQILFSFGLKGVSILIGLFLVPLLLDYLDQERYGIWLTLTSILGWFHFFDIGLGNGLRNKFTEAITKGDHELARIYVSTTYGIVIGIFSIVLVLFYVINPLLNWSAILNTSLVPSKELSTLSLVVFTFFILRFIFKLIGTILLADQRPAENNALEPISNVAVLLTILVLIHFTKQGSLVVLGAILSVIPVLVLIIATVLLFNGRYRRYRPTLNEISLKHSGELMGLGRRFFIIQISFMIFFTTSNIIITQILGPHEVTVYNIAHKYFSVPIMVYAIIMTPIWSAVTEAYIKTDFAWLRNVLRKLNFVSLLFVFGIVIMVLLSDYMYKIWIGNRVEVPFVLTASMALYATINVVLSPFSQFINGFGKLKLNTTIVVFQSMLFIPLAIILTKTDLGAAGTMLATCIINGIGLFVQPLQTFKILNLKARGIWNK